MPGVLNRRGSHQQGVFALSMRGRARATTTTASIALGSRCPARAARDVARAASWLPSARWAGIGGWIVQLTNTRRACFDGRQYPIMEIENLIQPGRLQGVDHRMILTGDNGEVVPGSFLHIENLDEDAQPDRGEELDTGQVDHKMRRCGVDCVLQFLPQGGPGEQVNLTFHHTQGRTSRNFADRDVEQLIGNESTRLERLGHRFPPLHR